MNIQGEYIANHLSWLLGRHVGHTSTTRLEGRVLSSEADDADVTFRMPAAGFAVDADDDWEEDKDEEGVRALVLTAIGAPTIAFPGIECA